MSNGNGNPASRQTKREKQALSQVGLPLLTADVRQVIFEFPPVDEAAVLTRFVLFQAADALGGGQGWRVNGIMPREAIAEQVTFINNGVPGWRFAHESAAAAAEDRIITPNARDWRLTERQFAVLWYDSGSDRWRILETNGA